MEHPLLNSGVKISPINEKEQNCCNNEIIVNYMLENEEKSKTNNQKGNHGSLHSRKKNRDTSSKLR